MYVIGSRRSSSEEYKSCYRFSPRTLEWTQLSPLLHDRSRFGIACINDYIYIFGGFEGFKRLLNRSIWKFNFTNFINILFFLFRSNRVYLNTIERYSIEEDRWEPFSSNGPIISSIASCSYNNSIIYFGGGKNVNWTKMSDFYSIDVKTKQIDKKANMLIARTTHQIVAHNDSLYVYGGFDDAGNGILSIESYNIQTNQWTLVTSVPGVASKTWPQSLGFINGKFYISVFHTPNTFRIMQKGYSFDLSTNMWNEAPVINERGRYCPTCSLSFPRKIHPHSSSSSPSSASTQNTQNESNSMSDDVFESSSGETNLNDENLNEAL